MLQDVIHTITDGLLKIPSGTGDGTHVKIGASPAEKGVPVLITGDMSAAQIRSRLGLSPLADAAMDAVQFGAGRFWCFPVAGTAGKTGAVSKTGEGSGSMTASGSPTNDFNVTVRFTVPGKLNTAAFQVSTDGGASFGEEITVPLNGVHEIAGTGVTLTFTEGEGDEADKSFEAGDAYTFTAEGPALSNGEMLSALAALGSFREEFELVHIVGESDPAAWTAAASAIKELRDGSHKFAFALLEASRPEAEEGLEDWAKALAEAGKKAGSGDIQVCAAWGLLNGLDGKTRAVNLAGAVSGLYSRAPVQVSIGKTREEAGFGADQKTLAELLPEGLDDGIIGTLDGAGFLTFRRYDGLDRFYVTAARMLAPEDSDYRYAEDVRVRNKIIRETRKEALRLIGEDIDTEDIQGELETRGRYLAAPLEKMINAGEISSASVEAVQGQAEAFLATGTARYRIRYVSRGVVRQIEVDLGRTTAETAEE